jgi:PAS domain S-box-containing protein
MFQFAGEEALGRLLDDLIVPREQLREARKLQRSSLRKKISSLETVRMRKDGSRVPVNIHTVPLEVEGHRAGVYAIYEDITRRKRAEEDAFRSQRIESIGSLAGGIAHDLNNVLAPILLAIEILKRRVADERAIQILDTLESSARRGSNMVRQILTFARGAGSEHITLEIRHLLTEMEKIFQETFPKSIRLRMEIGKDLRTLTGDGTQIHQVLLNLGVNARDAMPGGGVLTVLAENALVDHRYARLNPGAKAGEYVMVGVGDTGVGMTAEVKEKIFEPFFTTKEPGHGTGLGLSTVHAIVRNHAGFMNIHSEPGK